MIEWLNTIPLAGLMLVVALGFTLGRLEWRGLSLGPAGGTLLAAIALGRAGLSFRELYGGTEPSLTVGTFGFALFIYSVGFEAGPRFFSSLLGGPGWRFVLVGSVVNVTALLLSVAAAAILALDESVTAGLLAGALTSAPTFAAADEICSDPTALAVTFALTYPIGLAGVVLMVQFVPRLLGDDLAADADASGDEEAGGGAAGGELTRAFEVRSVQAVGRTLRDLDLTGRTGCYVTRLHRGPDVMDVSARTRLEAGDHVMVRGRLEELARFQEVVGPEVYDEDLRRRAGHVRRVRVTAREAVGVPLRDLDIPARFASLIVAVDRGGHALEPMPGTTLARGDIVHVQGRRENVRRLASWLGRFEQRRDQTDVAVYAAGIFLGLLLGQASLTAFGARLTLGTAGGLLLVGVLLGRFRYIGPFHAGVPRAARQLVRDLGILLFVAETGVRAGGSSFGVMEGRLAATLGASLAVTALSVLLALGCARRLLRMRPLHAWGSIGGGMTSSAALVAIKRAADSSEPAVSYAASYAVASVLATVAGQVVVLLVR